MSFHIYNILLPEFKYLSIKRSFWLNINILYKFDNALLKLQRSTATLIRLTNHFIHYKFEHCNVGDQTEW